MSQFCFLFFFKIEGDLYLQQDMVEKWARAPLSSRKPQRRTQAARACMCPGVPRDSKEESGMKLGC